MVIVVEKEAIESAHDLAGAAGALADLKPDQLRWSGSGSLVPTL